MTQAPPPAAPLTEMKLTDDLKNAINSSFTSGKPVLVAYVDADGQPSLSFRGSAIAYSDSQLAIWARNPEGGLQKALAANPRITLMYRDPTPESRSMLQFRGKAHMENADAVREDVYSRIPEAERNADKEKKGGPVIIDLERVDGFAPGVRVAMRK
jgi:hypothetical protein